MVNRKIDTSSNGDDTQGHGRRLPPADQDVTDPSESDAAGHLRIQPDPKARSIDADPAPGGR